MQDGLAPVEILRSCWRSADSLSRRNILTDSGLRTYTTPVTERNMPDYSGLPCQDAAIAYFGAAGNANLSNNKAVGSDMHIVRDLTEVIDFRSCPYGCTSQRSPIHRGIGPYFDIVADFNPAYLRNFINSLRRGDIAETVCTQHCSGMDSHLVAQW